MTYPQVTKLTPSPDTAIFVTVCRAVVGYYGAGRRAGESSIAPDPRTVLVVPFADGIGDFVLLLPLLRHVRRRFPHAAISVAASAP